MNILVVGSGGREHALVKAIRKNPAVQNLYCCPGNGGIAADAVCKEIRSSDIPAMVHFATENAIDFAVIAPDDPLVLGMVDAMEAAGIRCFGPTAAAAAIEGSKVFAKNLMQKYNIPTAAYGVFTNPKAAMEYIKAQNCYPVVIKADGLALGKGVIIAADYPQAEDAVRTIMEEKTFGKSGDQIVIEQFITGPEVSVLAFTDGVTVVPMVSAMDHKRALDNDKGPNTGGMGTIAPNPYYTPAIATRCMAEIYLPTIRAMAQEGRPFKGCLFFGLMLTAEGPKVIEYNCRFGDPETQVVLPLLKTDLLSIMQAVRAGTLADIDVQWHSGAAACIVMASGGYPQKYDTGIAITGLNPDGNRTHATIYHAGTKADGGVYKTAGGRVLGVAVKASTLIEALDNAYAQVEDIAFDRAHYRRDIGATCLK